MSEWLAAWEDADSDLCRPTVEVATEPRLRLMVTPLDPFGAEIRTPDIRSAAAHESIVKLLRSFTVLVIRDHAALSDNELSALAQAFGSLGDQETNAVVPVTRPDHPEISVISHMVVDGGRVGAGRSAEGGLFWHTDYTWQAHVGRVGLLDAVEVPTVGGETCFVDMRAVYAALPDVWRLQLIGARGVHVNDAGRVYGTAPDTTHRWEHPAVIADPMSGLPALYINHGFTRELIGPHGPLPDHLLDNLLEYAVRPEFVYEHKWRPGDLVIWNQMATIHCRRPYVSTARRYMRQISMTAEPGQHPVPVAYDSAD